MGVKSNDEKSKEPSVEQIDGFFMKMFKKQKSMDTDRRKKH